jgi:UDP-N-acetylglucosamine 2-epimerase
MNWTDSSEAFDVLTILGARPQFIKASVVSRALQQRGLREGVLHTGQHYDYEMDALFFKELGLRDPIANLGIGSGSHGQQTGMMMQQIEAFITSMHAPPKSVLVYGDTNSTLAGALVAAKMNLPIFHVEAGLRSFNRTMPEEINRILTDQLSALLFCPSKTAVENLRKEGIYAGVHEIGDVMFTAFQTFRPFAQAPHAVDIDWNTPFGLVTIHRPSNTNNTNGLNHFFEQLGAVKQQFLWPVHPRVLKTLPTLQLPHNIITCKPLGYFEMLFVLGKCNTVLTDSGGLQKEAYWAGKPTLTLRKDTEWVETVKAGWNRLADLESDNFLDLMDVQHPLERPPLYENPQSCSLIADHIHNFIYS